MPESHPIPSNALFKNLTGRRFGRLTVISLAAKAGRHYRWNCRCECGTERIVFHDALLRKLTTSCGCFRVKKTLERITTHGQSKTLLYGLWRGMISRCENRNAISFPQYGGRGITVCTRWRESFLAFKQDMGPRPRGTSLERMDNEGPYCPENCRWATRTEQARNRRSSKFITFKGETLTKAGWAERLGVPINAIHYRSRMGLPLDIPHRPIPMSHRG